ncbi:hypothetical protein B296_00004588 [Ensete ventricosum]|uniref:t-SNARE coiled-coil homology domain-containing protein n=1 Tax=Ensete ventricosum TaxID=4639 RepID=A0A427AJD5_ENSVE|nr:hypothetical protein B296_00004588 [Ensete ventricosum]
MPVSRGAKQRSSDTGLSKPDPFDSDSEPEMNPKHGRSSSGTATAARNRYKNDFRDDGGLENQSVQELENYAAHKAEETTQKVNDCLKIAEVIREDASNTLVMLHQQGEQITRTHETAVSIDQDLSRVEKTKQDDTLSDLSDVLGQLKGMAVDMGTEMDRLDINLFF